MREKRVNPNNKSCKRTSLPKQRGGKDPSNTSYQPGASSRASGHQTPFVRPKPALEPKRSHYFREKAEGDFAGFADQTAVRSLSGRAPGIFDSFVARQKNAPPAGEEEKESKQSAALKSFAARRKKESNAAGETKASKAQLKPTSRQKKPESAAFKKSRPSKKKQAKRSFRNHHQQTEKQSPAGRRNN